MLNEWTIDGINKWMNARINDHLMDGWMDGWISKIKQGDKKRRNSSVFSWTVA